MMDHSSEIKQQKITAFIKKPGYLFLSLPFLSVSAFAAGNDSNSQKNHDEQEPLIVYGRALSVYQTAETSLVTRTPTPIDEIPASVQVLPQQLIEDQGARQITDLYRSISGVSQFSYSYVTFRGFRQDEILYDGVRGNPFEGLAVPQLFNIERIEVLKGPSAAVMGSGEPGGVINYVTKKPTDEPSRHLSLTTGNEDFVSGSMALSGPVNETHSQRYRIGIYQDHENPYRRNTDIRNRIIDLGYEWDMTPETTVAVQYTDIIQHYGGGRIRGIPTDDQGNFLTGTDWNANNASDFFSLDAEVYQVRVDHELSDRVSANVTLRYFENEDIQKYHEPKNLQDKNNDGVYDWVDREYRDQLRTNKAGSVTANLVADLDQHVLLFGADYYRLDSDFIYYKASTAGGVSGLSLINPDYTPDNVSTYSYQLANHTDTQSERYGAYIQDQWALADVWNLLSGIRLDGYRDEINDIRMGQFESYTGSGISYRVGSTYQLNEQIHPYAVVATGYVPQDAADQATSNGGPFDPEESLMYEAGARTYWFDNRLNANLAVYHIVKDNVLQTDPNDDSKMVAFGKVRSQGIEIDMMADLTADWVANLSYAYNDTLVKQAYDGISRTVGRRFANAPHHQLGLWTRYDFSAIRSSVGFGANYVGQQWSQDGQIVQSYTVYDASWQTHWQDWKFQLNIKNLFDKTYAVSGFLERTGHFPGERRRIYLTADYAF